MMTDTLWRQRDVLVMYAYTERLINIKQVRRYLKTGGNDKTVLNEAVNAIYQATPKPFSELSEKAQRLLQNYLTDPPHAFASVATGLQYASHNWQITLHREKDVLPPDVWLTSLTCLSPVWYAAACVATGHNHE